MRPLPSSESLTCKGVRAWVSTSQLCIIFRAEHSRGIAVWFPDACAAALAGWEPAGSWLGAAPGSPGLARELAGGWRGSWLSGRLPEPSLDMQPDLGLLTPTGPHSLLLDRSFLHLLRGIAAVTEQNVHMSNIQLTNSTRDMARIRKCAKPQKYAPGQSKRCCRKFYPMWRGQTSPSHRNPADEPSRGECALPNHKRTNVDARCIEGLLKSALSRSEQLW